VRAYPADGAKPRHALPESSAKFQVQEVTKGDAKRARLYELALKGGPHLRLASSEWLRRLEAQRMEIQDAISSYMAAGDERGAEMASAVWRLWWLGGHLDEGRILLVKVLDSGLATSPEVRADLLRGLGTIVFRQADNDEAERIFSESLAIARALDPVRHVNALCDLSRVALRRGEFASVRTYARRAYELAESVPGDEGKDARRVPAHMLAAAARMQADYAQARRYYEESQNISRELGNEANVAGEHHNLGYVDLHSGELEGARRHFRQALEWVASTATCISCLTASWTARSSRSATESSTGRRRCWPARRRSSR
jgi:tetratricopeptide (TPR) repeat protein